MQENGVENGVLKGFLGLFKGFQVDWEPEKAWLIDWQLFRADPPAAEARKSCRKGFLLIQNTMKNFDLAGD